MIKNEQGKPGKSLGWATPPGTSRVLTVRVLVVHHVQVILICFHISQQVVRRDVAALRLLVVCVPREREISSPTSGTWLDPRPPRPAPVCQAVSEPDGSAPHRSHVPGTCSHHCGGHGGKASFFNIPGLCVLHPEAAAHPNTPIYGINSPVYPISGLRREEL